MDRTTHERALDAARRLALGTLLLAGCDREPAVAGAPTTPGPMPANTKPAAADGDLDASASKSAKPRMSKTDECRALIDAKLGKSDVEWWRDPDHREATPELTKCCTELTQVNDAGWVDNTNEVRSAGCCRVNFPGAGPACTPWGPPVPPRMTA